LEVVFNDVSHPGKLKKLMCQYRRDF